MSIAYKLSKHRLGNLQKLWKEPWLKVFFGHVIRAWKLLLELLFCNRCVSSEESSESEQLAMRLSGTDYFVVGACGGNCSMYLAGVVTLGGSSSVSKKQTIYFAQTAPLLREIKGGDVIS